MLSAVAPASLLLSVPSGIGERHVTEHVREVAQLTPMTRIVFFGQETDIVAHFKQALEKSLGIVMAPKQD